MVFDFAPQIDIGAEMLSRRGEDQRFDAPAARGPRRRRAATGSATPASESGDGDEDDAGADVARRLDRPRLSRKLSSCGIDTPTPTVPTQQCPDDPPQRDASA